MSYLIKFLILFLFSKSIFPIFVPNSNMDINAKKPVVPIKSDRDAVKNRRGRVTNGYIAETGSRFLPFYTLLYVRRNVSSFSMCAGSIISPNFVISAGHCFEKCIEVFILAGFNSSQIDSFSFFDQIPSNRIITHPEYNPTTIANDIALIELSRNISYGLILQRIKLPSVLTTFVNKTGIVSGFGTYSDSNPMTSDVLRYAFVTVINGLTCLVSYGSTFFNSDKQMCIDTKSGSSTCSGDSGGSLGIFVNNELNLAGIVSYGSDKGCELGNPEVYTNVKAYLTWIRNKTGILS